MQKRPRKKRPDGSWAFFVKWKETGTEKLYFVKASLSQPYHKARIAKQKVYDKYGDQVVMSNIFKL